MELRIHFMSDLIRWEVVVDEEIESEEAHASRERGEESLRTMSPTFKYALGDEKGKKSTMNEV